MPATAATHYGSATTGTAFKGEWEEPSKKGLRLIDFDTWVDGTKRRYAGVYRQGVGGHALWVGKGLRLIDLEVFGPKVG